MIDELLKKYRENADQYRYDPDVMREDSDRTARLKYIMDHELTPADRVILVAYSELASYRDLGALLGCSAVTARAQMERIRRQIKELW